MTRDARCHAVHVKSIPQCDLKLGTTTNMDFELLLGLLVKISCEFARSKAADFEQKSWAVAHGIEDGGFG